MPQHRFSIGFNTFILVTTASSSDVTAINMLMIFSVIMCKWSIVCDSVHRFTTVAGKRLNSLIVHDDIKCNYYVGTDYVCTYVRC